MKGKELSATEFLELMRSEERAGGDEWLLERRGLVRVGDAYCTRETAEEILREIA